MSGDDRAPGAAGGHRGVRDLRRRRPARRRPRSPIPRSRCSSPELATQPRQLPGPGGVHRLDGRPGSRPGTTFEIEILDHERARRARTSSPGPSSAAIGRGSGAEVEMESFWMTEVRDGRFAVVHAVPDARGGARRRPRARGAALRIDCRADGRQRPTRSASPTRPSPTRSGARRSASTRDAIGPTTRSTTIARRRVAAGFRDVVAPPMFCVVYSAPALGPAVLDPEVGMNLATMVHGGQEFVWGEPVCAGDEITTDDRGDRDLRARRQGLLRVRVGVDQPGRRRGRARHLDRHREGGLR